MLANYSGDPNFSASSGSLTEQINPQQTQQTQTIMFPDLGTQSYGVAPITLTARASSGLPVTYVVNSGPATVSGSTLTITGVGSVKVQASQVGNTNYSAATPVSVTFTVNKAVLMVTASTQTMTYRGTIPALTYTITGFVNGETAAVVGGSATCTTTATSSSAIGEYPITCSTGTLSAANYSFSFVNGYLMVNATTPGIPRVTTLPTSRIASTTVTVSGMVQPNGAVTTYWFEYGTRAANLTQISSQTLPPGTVQAAVNTQLIGLVPLTVYYYRVVASNSAGISQGRILEFRTGGQKAASDSTLPISADSAVPQTGNTAAASASSALATVRNAGAKATAGTTVSTQTAALEVALGRSTPLVVNLAGVIEGMPMTATCTNLPEGTTCNYDDKTQTVTIVPSVSTPPGSYQVGVVVTAAPGTE
jgi:hypothetical protein